MLTSPDRVEPVTEHIDFYNFGEDAEITDRSEETAMLGLAGPGTPEVIAAVAGPDVWPDGPGTFAEASIGGMSALLVRTDFLRVPGVDLIVSAGQQDAASKTLAGLRRVPRRSLRGRRCPRDRTHSSGRTRIRQ